MQKNPINLEYDYGLGIEPTIIDYIIESMEIQSRISSTPCYLFFQNTQGSNYGSTVTPITVVSYSETDPNSRTIIWSSGSNHPDLRPYINNGSGSIIVKSNGNIMTRVLDVDDLNNDNEFAVVRRNDLFNKQIEIVFNRGYDPTGSTITYYYTTMNPEIHDERFKHGENSLHSIFGWTQYTWGSADAFRRKNQILVRFPITTGDLQVNEEGKVLVEENKCWMTSEPLVNDFDMLVIAAEDSPYGKEARFEIVDKNDSIIQGRLITQRFSVKRLEDSDPRYSIPIVRQ